MFGISFEGGACEPLFFLQLPVRLARRGPHAPKCQPLVALFVRLVLFIADKQSFVPFSRWNILLSSEVERHDGRARAAV